MRKVFVTGATGYVGSAIVARLVRAGLDVHALTRTPERALRLQAAGARPLIGSLRERNAIISELKNCDAVVHAAIDEDDSEAADQSALELIRTAAEDGRVRRLLYTSGVWVHGDTGGAVVDETSPLAAAGPARWRPAHERAALDLADAEVLTVVLRPGLVYGGRGGILGAWFQEAQEHGTVTFPGDGSQHWGLVHREDMAEGYALALEHAVGAECYLLVDDSRHTVLELAEAVALATGARAIADDAPGRARTLSPSDLAKRMDQRFTAARARRELGWVPRHGSFVAQARALYDEWQRLVQAPGLTLLALMCFTVA